MLRRSRKRRPETNAATMTIGKQFNTLTKGEYIYYIDNHEKYTDFNTLGLYRSLTENEQLTTEDRIAIREYAHLYFRKSFDFLQVKDPVTYADVTTLGRDLTKGEEMQLWEEIRRNQEQILKDKRIKTRSFGTYSKHVCDHDWCPYRNVMLPQGSRHRMKFHADKSEYSAEVRAERSKYERRNKKNIIRRNLGDE